MASWLSFSDESALEVYSQRCAIQIDGPSSSSFLLTHLYWVESLCLSGVRSDQGAGPRSSSTSSGTSQHRRVSATDWEVGVDRLSVSHETIHRLSQWLAMNVYEVGVDRLSISHETIHRLSQRLAMNIYELHYYLSTGLDAFLAHDESRRTCSRIVSSHWLKTGF